jgi:4-amino-4-deoxy-L-arabinose transferase-like glycosyltransferase
MTVLVVALAVVLRIAWVLAVPSKPVGDFAMYVESAAHLVEHGSLDPEYVYMPGYVLLIAPVQALGGGWLATKLVGAVLGGVGAGPVAGIARRLCGGSSRAALVAGLLYAFWPAGIAIASVTGTDMPAAVLILFAWYCLVRFSAERPVVAAILFGLCTGLAAYIRAIVVPLAALAVLVLRAQGHTWRASTRWAALACAIALLTLAPWAVRNRLRYGETFFTDSHAGLTALVGANPDTDGCYSRSLNRMFRDVTGFSLLAEPHREAERAALAIAKDWIRFDPLYSLGLLASKAERLLAHERALLYWPLYRAGVLAEPERAFFARHRSAIETLADDFYLSLLALALMGIALALLRRNWLALSLLPQAAVLVASYTAIFAEPRYRLPIFTLLVPFAALALQWLAQTGRGLLRRAPPISWKREGLVAAGCATAVFAGAQCLAWAGARLREHYRWAVHECLVAGHPQFCKWKTTAVDGELAETPGLRGVWNGVGLAIPRPSGIGGGSVTAETDLFLDPGNYTVAFSVELTAPDWPGPDAEGTITVAANARSLGEPIALHALATRAGNAPPWRADLDHPGGLFRLQVRATTFPGDHPQSARLWVGDLRVLRNNPR